MPDEITFMDLASLLSIGPDTTLEKLGSAINANFFDASNIAGSLKQKGLIDFSASYPGPNTVTITDTGKALISEADAKAASPYDNLDDAVLVQVSGGKRLPLELQNTLNIRPKDLALRIYKLSKQGYLTYDLKSGGVIVMLTDSGFLKSKTASAMTPPAPTPAATTQPAQQKTATAQGQDEQIEVHDLSKAKSGSKTIYLLVALLIVIILAASYFLKL